MKNTTARKRPLTTAGKRPLRIERLEPRIVLSLMFLDHHRDGHGGGPPNGGGGEDPPDPDPPPPVETTTGWGDAHFNKRLNWVDFGDGATSGVDLPTVAAHEFGHSLGLLHSDGDCGDEGQPLMCPFYLGPALPGELGILQTEDITRIQDLYPETGDPTGKVGETHWASTNVTYSFMPGGEDMEQGGANDIFGTLDAAFASDPDPTAKWQGIFAEALDLWAVATAADNDDNAAAGPVELTFTEVPDDGSDFDSPGDEQGDPGVGDIRIGDHRFGGDPFAALAHAYLSPVENLSIPRGRPTRLPELILPHLLMAQDLTQPLRTNLNDGLLLVLRSSNSFQPVLEHDTLLATDATPVTPGELGLVSSFARSIRTDDAKDNGSDDLFAPLDKVFGRWAVSDEVALGLATTGQANVPNGASQSQAKTPRR